MKHKHSLLKQQLVAAVVGFYINSEICEKLLHTLYAFDSMPYPGPSVSCRLPSSMAPRG